MNRSTVAIRVQLDTKKKVERIAKKQKVSQIDKYEQYLKLGLRMEAQGLPLDRLYYFTNTEMAEFANAVLRAKHDNPNAGCGSGDFDTFYKKTGRSLVKEQKAKQ